uniref:Carboxylic ester hydrolase n=1 Tax=Pseudonaja textilis TaxID=8673 RepID=A0A670ZKX2_PSETE
MNRHKVGLFSIGIILYWLSFFPGPLTCPSVAMPCLLCPSLLCCLLLVLLPFPLASSCASNGDTVVITSSGPIKGKQFLSGLGPVTAYLGIPYAEPPLGKLRFQKPLPHQPWKQPLEATSFGNSCPQFISQDVPEAHIWSPKTPLSEDCLSLNIWVPHPQPSAPVPVLVWIHGGGYFMGTSSVAVFNGAPLAATENVIVVTINYRLGALGFLYFPPAAPGNLGLLDQQLALKWVKENAAAFGGDPSRVTIFGQSAGGASVNFHLLAPKSQDLFAQAVIQSGTANAFWAWRSPEEAKRISLEFLHLLGCSEDNKISLGHCLQTKNVSELIRHEIAMSLKGGFLLNFPFRPTTDGDFLLGEPEKLMEEGQIQVKPVVMAAGNIRKTGSPVYAYLFTHRPSWSVWPEWIGASHSSEVPYVFGTLESVMPVNQTYTEAEARLSRKMMHNWAEFARTGNPSGSAATKDKWPLYDPTKHNLFLFNIGPFQERVKEHCAFLKSLLSKDEEPLMVDEKAVFKNHFYIKYLIHSAISKN